MTFGSKITKFWFGLSDKLRFLFVGGFNFVFSYFLYSALLYFILGEEHYRIALILSWALSAVVSFTTQRLLVFPVKGNLFKQFSKCCTTWFISYIINALLLEIFVNIVRINPYIGQLIATSACAVFTYIMFKVFAFKGEQC